MRAIFTLALFGFLFSCTTEIKYPPTAKISVIDTYFDTQVEDPYRWLEDDTSPEVKEWITKQNELTFSFLAKIPQREKIKNRLEDLWNYEKIGTPFEKGDYTYFYKNDGLQNQYVLYRKKGEEQESVFIDPNQFSEDGTISLAGTSFSEDGSLLAYSISEGGSDWRKVIVIETANKTQVEDTLLDIKFSGISWNGNEGFYYSSYDKPEKSALSDKTDQHKLYYHILGTPQKEDKVIFGDKQKFRYVRGHITKDQQYLVISASKATSGNNLYIQNRSKKDAPLIQITDNFESNSYISHNIGSKLYIITNLNAPNKRMITTDASNPQVENWTDFISENRKCIECVKRRRILFCKVFY